MISENTYKYVKEDFVCRELDQIRVKGKEQSVRIFELIGTKEEVSQDAINQIAVFAEALNLYRQKNFSAAAEKFKTLVGDAPSEAFVKRCEQFIQTPPPAEWDGVYTFTVK